MYIDDLGGPSQNVNPNCWESGWASVGQEATPVQPAKKDTTEKLLQQNHSVFERSALALADLPPAAVATLVSSRDLPKK